LRNMLSPLVTLLKIWVFMFISYLAILLAFNWIYFGWIDLRSATLVQILVMPTGQSLAFWLLTRRSRRGAAESP
jgi:hypothetical protein